MHSDDGPAPATPPAARKSPHPWPGYARECESQSEQRPIHHARRPEPLPRLHIWLMEWSEAAKPGNGIFLAIGRSLGRSGFARDLYALQSRPAARAAIFIYHLPESATHQLNLFRGKIEPQITVNPGFS